MTAYNVVNPTTLQSGQSEDISQVLANFTAIAAVLNGNIDNANINVAAAIAASKLAGYPADGSKVLKGDGTWGTGGAMTLIDDLVVSGAALATYDTNTRLGGNIPQTYKHLVMFTSLRTDAAVFGNTALIRFNNDSAANYDYADIVGFDPASSGGGGARGSTSIIQPALYTGASSPANSFGVSELKIIDYAGAQNKGLVGTSYAFFQNVAGNSQVQTGGGVWLSTAAVTRIQIIPQSGLWAIGSRFSFYGVN